jgi:hypothetical protein
MDASPTPRQTIRLSLDVNQTPDGRLEGRICPDGTDAWEPFSGVLELLKMLEATFLTCIESDARNTSQGKRPGHENKE